MPQPAPRPRRRINPDKPPLDQLPLIRADELDGPIYVVRGEFDLTQLTDAQREYVATMDGHDVVVFTNALGQHRLAWRNQLVDRDLDLSRVGDLPTEERPGGDPDVSRTSSISAKAMGLRYRAQQLLDLAELYDSLVADGWEIQDDPATARYGNIVQRHR